MREVKKLKRTRRYYERNKHFQVWMPESLYLWFLDYLHNYSYGGSIGEEFRIMLFEMQRLESEGVTFANPRKDKVAQRRKDIEEIYGRISEQDLICLAHRDRSKMTQREKGLSCGYCRETQKALFKACQEIREEYNQLNSP